MRIYILAAALLVLTASCGNSAEQATQAEGTPAGAPAMQASSDPNVKKDPVCEMAYDAEWTEYTVHNGDTIRFCSDGCKMAFEARPEKYLRTK
ncbi:hypothetical protein GCM10023093_27250 [Nemorincola caseinilytica]|uniref:YHS domain-containing protein n=1 Tax=Nemorincola caseinilytica TaxID=2054315 RepID=A0ABP8NPC0_9BACT